MVTNYLIIMKINADWHVWEAYIIASKNNSSTSGPLAQDGSQQGLYGGWHCARASELGPTNGAPGKSEGASNIYFYMFAQDRIGELKLVTFVSLNVVLVD